MKRHDFKIILIAVIATFFLNLFFGKFLMAKISTWPLLNRFKILSPQAPIVINQREEIRLTDNGQFGDAVSSARPKISAIALKGPSGFNFTGAAVNLTADGLMVSTKKSFEQKGEYWVFFADGKVLPVKNLSFDPATELVFFTIEAQGLPIAPLADSKTLASGEKIFWFANLTNGEWQGWTDYLRLPENYRSGVIFAAGKPVRTLLTALPLGPQSGLVALNVKGEVAGLAGGAIIPADEIKAAMSIYLSDRQNFTRPVFDFNFIELTTAEAAALDVPAGARVTQASKTEPLKTGDVITAVGGVKLGSGNFLEEQLEKYKSGSAVEFSVSREGKNITLTIKAK